MVMLGSYAPVSQKGRVLRAVVKEMEVQQIATKFLLTTPPCLISATLQSVHALYNGCPCGLLGSALCMEGTVVLHGVETISIYTLYLRLCCLVELCFVVICVLYCVFAIPSGSVQ